MSKLAITFLVFALTGAAVGGAAPPQVGQDSMNALWEKFKAAVTKGDKEAVFGMSQLPIGLGYGMRDIKTKAQFIRDFRYLFAKETDAVKCFRTAKPEVDQKRKEFLIACPFAKDSSGEEPFVYTFKLTRRGWRFVGFENINE